MKYETVPGMLIENGIMTKSFRAGHSERIVCPKCAGGKTREKCLSVTIDNDEMGAVWTCFRGNCGWKGGGKVGTERSATVYNIAPKVAANAIKPEPHRPEAIQRGDLLYGFFAGRKISPETVDEFGC